MQNFLDRNCIDNEIIDYRFEEKAMDPRKLFLPERKAFKKESLGIDYLSQINSNFREGMEKRNECMKDFEDIYLRVSDTVYCLRQARELAEKKYEAVICGSDQIWLPSNVIEKYYTLSFLPESVKKAAYAPSFGVSSIPAWLKGDYKRFLQKFDILSAREDTGAEMIRSLTGRQCPVVADPVMLLTDEEWKEAMNVVRLKPFRAYILGYFLGDSERHRKAARELADKTGMELKIIPSGGISSIMDTFYSDRDMYRITPKDFVSLIRNADLVVTDSFHGTVFSILFGKPFYYIERFSSENRMSTNSRVYSLLRLMGLEDRLLKWDAQEFPVYGNIDYTKAKEQEKELRKMSSEFLLAAAGGRK